MKASSTERQREECELDKVEHKTNEVGLRIVTLGTREACSEKPTKFLKDTYGTFGKGSPRFGRIRKKTATRSRLDVCDSR